MTYIDLWIMVYRESRKDRIGHEDCVKLATSAVEACKSVAGIGFGVNQYNQDPK